MAGFDPSQQCKDELKNIDGLEWSTIADRAYGGIWIVDISWINGETPLAYTMRNTPYNYSNLDALFPGTIGDYMRQDGGTRLAWTEPRGNAIYLNTGSDYWHQYTDTPDKLGAMVLHEMLHLITGLNDGDIQKKLGLEQRVASDNITQLLRVQCFGGTEEDDDD